MTYDQLLQYCFFFRGEAICPQHYENKHEGKLWQAEKAICEDLSSLVDSSNARVSIARAVSLYVGKWHPYKLFDIMDIYFEKCPELRSKLT